jgi:hypothetical protein
MLPVMQVRDASRYAVQELLEAPVQLAEVAEDERLYRAELVGQILLAAPYRVLDVVAVGTLPVPQTAARAAGTGNLVRVFDDLISRNPG